MHFKWHCWAYCTHKNTFFSSSFVFFFFFICLNADLPLWAQSLSEWRGWESQGGNRSNPTAENKKGTAISLYSWGPCTHTLGLEGLGLQPKNCGSVHWMAAVFRDSGVHKKQYVLSELHLRKHLGTGQGPAAEGSCHWGPRSHWCASVQRPCRVKSQKKQKSTRTNKHNKGIKLQREGTTQHTFLPSRSTRSVSTSDR